MLRLSDELNANIGLMLNGVIFKKAQQENFVNVYTNVFQRMHELENEEDIVLVLGEVGG